MNNTLIEPNHFEDFNLTELAKLSSNKFDPAVLLNTSKVQLLAIQDINQRWALTKQSTASFLRRVDTNFIHYPHIEATQKNIALFTLAAKHTMEQLVTTLEDLKFAAAQSIVVSFNGTIGNRTGLFLIEFFTEYIQEYVDSVKAMKFLNPFHQILFNDLLNFYENQNISPFNKFNLDTFRHLYLPR